MVTPRTLEIAEAILAYTSQSRGGIIALHSCAGAVKPLAMKPSEKEIRLTAEWLSREGFLLDSGDRGTYSITATGEQVAGKLQQHLATLEGRAEAQHAANVATTNGVRTAKWTAWVAILISIGALFKDVIREGVK